MANLLIEIGNTALKAAWSEGVTLGKTFRYQGEKLFEFILSLTEKEKPVVMAVVCVRPLSADEEALLRPECRHLMVLDSAHPDILQRYGLPDYLSYDRAASLIAVRYLFKGKACTVFDFGTTLTIDFIDADGLYRGGNVSPGCRTRFKALNRYSRALPLLNTPERVPHEGHSVESSIEAGVVSGIMFEISGYIGARSGNVVVFTGGDAIYFAKRMKNSIFVVCNLGLVGLALISDDYVEKNIV
ncbi:MAG: type III pantothenate kinase [Bacteroidales bacterium]|nr:type III pantothenate kinase [Bacteroidales bacterium]